MSSDNTTTTQQSSQTNPYAPSIPLLANEASVIGSTPTAVTPGQTSALNTLTNESAAVPELGVPATGAVTNNLTASNAPTQGMLQDAYGNYVNNTNPIATGDTNPLSTPGFEDALNYMNTNALNSTKSMYAGSGRDPSGAGSFGKSLIQAEAPAEGQLISSQFNSNVANKLNANAGQEGAATGTASGISSEEEAALQQQLQGLGGAGMLPGIITAPGQTQYTTANTAYGTPWTNLSPALAASEGIGGMGGTGTGSGTTTQQTSPITNILGLLTGGLGVAGAVAKSDKRLKENIKHVGDLHDGQKVHQFNWKGDPNKTPQIGLLAQEVEKVRPDAVHEIGGVKHVDYSKATSNARRIGMLQVAA